MRFINVRQLLSNIQEEAKDLPFTVTRYGRPIFTAVHPGEVGTLASVRVDEEMLSENVGITDEEWKRKAMLGLSDEERGQVWVEDPQ